MIGAASPVATQKTVAMARSMRRYQLTVCSQPKLVWFRNAKVGTRTLYRLLQDASVEFEIEHEFDVPFDAELYREHYKFAMVRNPWDRLVSGWKNKIHEKNKRILRLSEAQRAAFQDFGAFAEYVATLDGETCNVHFRCQSALISVSEVDHIARFERYEDELRSLFAGLGMRMPETIPHRNRSRRKEPYQSYYTAKTRDLIAAFYRNDIETFGYTFDDS